LGGAGALSGLLAACGGNDDDDGSGSTGGGDAEATSTPGESEPTATESSDEGTGDGPTGELIIAAVQDSYQTEPNQANIGMYPVKTDIFETLVRVTPDYQVEPLLAETWEFIEPNTWRFNLRQDVVFHDGTPFTAEAVQWTMSRIVARGGGVLGVDENSVEIVDDYTIDITPSRPNRRLVQQLVHPSNSIVAPNTEPAEERVGTGPFREVEYVREDRYVVEAFEDYWGEPARLERITFRFMPDATTRMLALQAGEVDLIYDVPRESAGELTTGGDLRLVTSLVGAYEAIYINIHGEEPYDLGQDLAIRDAIAHAIDKEAIVNGVWRGNAEVNSTMIPSRILGPAGDVIEATPFDLDMAIQILDDAGWAPGDDGVREKDGRRLQLEMIVGFPNAEIHKPMPELVQAQLKEAGIEIEIVQTPDTPTYEERLAAGEGDLWAEVGNQNDANPCFLPDLLFYSPDPEGDPESQMYGNSFAPGSEFDAHIDDCRSAVTVEEVQDAAAQAMKALIDDEKVVIPIAGIFRIYGASSKVEDFEAHPSSLNQRWATLSVRE
jgi:peptide/nickel transport system substrate-binding protein